YLTRGEPVLLEIWKKVADEFMKENPGITVRIENVDYNGYWSKILTMITAGTPPDVIFLESNRMTGYIEKGALTDLTPFLTKNKEFRIKDFFDVAIQPYMKDKHVYGLPNDVAAIVMFYNKSLFDEAGLPYPKKGWTWDDLIKVSKKLTKDKNKDNVIDQYGLAYYDSDLAISQNNGSMFNRVEKPTQCLLNTKAVKEAVKFCYDLSYTYKVAPKNSDFQDTDGRMMFIMGRVAMIPDGHWMVPKFKKEITGFKWDVVVMPRKKKMAGSGRGSCLAIPAESKNKEAAFRFIKFATGFEGQKLLMQSDFSAPALKSIAGSEYFLSPPPQNERAFIDMIKCAELEPKLSNWDEVRDYINRELDKIWLDLEPMDKVLDETTRDVNKMLK
ncbi:MAG: sugar ABC transporter substrate-binding protein, partial [bacterium]|nr:sugar ABC transporter substrate-binding protein [bacterium]